MPGVTTFVGVVEAVVASAVVHGLVRSTPPVVTTAVVSAGTVVAQAVVHCQV